jgi:hypothetical protein
VSNQHLSNTEDERESDDRTGHLLPLPGSWYRRRAGTHRDRTVRSFFHHVPPAWHASGAPATTKPPATTSTSHHSTATLAKYKTEADAKGACGSDSVVWANTSSKVLHASGDKYYGHTTHGAYVCQSAAQKAGYHAAK